MAITNQTIINPIDLKPNVAIGLQLPITNGNTNILNQNYITFDQVKSNLRNLLLTEPGERIMLPKYGLGLKRRLFDQQSAKYINNIEQDIRTAILKWMPYINIDTILITQEEYSVTVAVNFIWLNESGNITLNLVNDIV